MTISRLERTNDPEETIRRAIEGELANFWVMLPAVVTDAGKLSSENTISAQPTVMAEIEQKDGSVKKVSMPILPDLPVMFPCGGGYTLTFPIKPGDECMVVFSSRNFDNWWNSGGIQEQWEPNISDISDGMAIVGIRSRVRAIPVKETAVQLKSDDGSSFVEIDGQDITAQAAGNFKAINGSGAIVNLQGGQIQVSAPENIALSAPQGVSFDSGGSISMNAPGGFVVNGKRIDQHVHDGVQPGSGNTGLNQ